jgi:hypothetical protein
LVAKTIQYFYSRCNDNYYTASNSRNTRSYLIIASFAIA